MAEEGRGPRTVQKAGSQRSQGARAGAPGGGSLMLTPDTSRAAAGGGADGQGAPALGGGGRRGRRRLAGPGLCSDPAAAVAGGEGQEDAG